MYFLTGDDIKYEFVLYFLQWNEIKDLSSTKDIYGSKTTSVIVSEHSKEKKSRGKEIPLVWTYHSFLEDLP